MTFCGRCGTKNPDENQFCEKCGSRLHQADSVGIGDSSVSFPKVPSDYMPPSSATPKESPSKSYESGDSSDDSTVRMVIWSGTVDSKTGAVELPKVPYTKDQQESFRLIAKVMGIITAVSIIAVLFIPMTYTKSGIASHEVDLTLWDILSNGMVSWGAIAMIVLAVAVISAVLNPSFGYFGVFVLFFIGIFTINLTGVQATYLSYDYTAGDNAIVIDFLRAVIPGIFAAIGGYFVKRGIIKYSNEIVDDFAAVRRLWKF